MGAPKGNKYNEIWTWEKTEDLVLAIYEHVLLNEDCYSIEEACVAQGQYEKLVYYLRDKHNGGKDFDAFKKAKALIKSRLIKKGLDNTNNSTMSIFVLKVQHEMVENQYVHHSININPKRWSE